MTKKFIINLLLVCLFIFYGKAIGQEYVYDVAYEPTSYEIVEQMLKIANVRGDDIIYDLGCGDGRIVITAAKIFGAKGIGIDINPVRISESKENAIKEGVTDKVRFIEQNLFKADISEATVVTLFLLPSVNLKLRPKLFSELKPGTRIVSHEHYMGEWKPDQTLEKYSDGWNHTVYFWVLPANVSGTWEWSESSRTGKRRYIFNLFQKFQEVNGTLTAEGVNVPVNNVTIDGDRLQFTLEEEIGDQKVTKMFEGLANGNSIEGTIVSKATTISGESNWRAKRDPSTVIPIDDSD
ncbi:SAM-dependent methyltransferase [Candidatus Latescibacterota bacterium]